jgi:outer membrane protein assembly factor BamA
MPSNVGLSAALFADGGIAWNKSNEFDRQRLHVGWGLGLRILAPAVDMMRFDVGFDKEGSWRIHIASFSKMRGQRLRLR